MTLTRGRVLTIGPVLLIATCYAVAAPTKPVPPRVDLSQSADDAEAPCDSNRSLIARCEQAAEHLRTRLPAPWMFVVREPFILGGDLTLTDLERYHDQTIVPTARALAASYFETPLNRPVTILLCSSDERFRECNQRLDDQDRSQYSGLYVRKERRVIVNVASGEGTLAHELTHALAHADFPQMPEWFDEGLASLHEECEFSPDGQQLLGRDNWRQAVAANALQSGELRMLEDVTSNRFASVDRAHVDYAHVRSLSLYLQERGLLTSFYRTCRQNWKTDPTGLRSLCEVTEVDRPQALDDQFHHWLITRRPVTESN